MNGHTFAALSAVTVLAAGCAALNDPGARLAWQDQWGDRGAGVLARDHAMCSGLVETRRSLMSSCMQQRGWQLEPKS